MPSWITALEPPRESVSLHLGTRPRGYAAVAVGGPPALPGILGSEASAYGPQDGRPVAPLGGDAILSRNRAHLEQAADGAWLAPPWGYGLRPDRPAAIGAVSVDFPELTAREMKQLSQAVREAWYPLTVGLLPEARKAISRVETYLDSPNTLVAREASGAAGVARVALARVQEALADGVPTAQLLQRSVVAGAVSEVKVKAEHLAGLAKDLASGAASLDQPGARPQAFAAAQATDLEVGATRSLQQAAVEEEQRLKNEQCSFVRVLTGEMTWGEAWDCIPGNAYVTAGAVALGAGLLGWAAWKVWRAARADR